LVPRSAVGRSLAKREPRNEIASPNDREPALMRSSRLVLLLACLSLAACEAQRARLAADAQTSMVGRTKEQVLACMGPPADKATEGAAEVWSYLSGDGSMDTMQSSGGGFISGAKSQHSCTINLTMVGGRVSKVTYARPSGEPLTPNQQCAFALEDCIPH
jgi:hypothetical protein